MTSDNPTAAEGLARARDLLKTLCGWSDSEFAMIAMGDDGETLKGRIEGVIADLLDRRPIPAGDDLDCGAMDIAELGHFVEAHRSTPTDATAVEDEREWQPIETLDATKLSDGDEMLICNDRGIFVGAWDSEWMAGVDTLPNLGNGWWLISDGKDAVERPLRGDVPTHWMPLPSPPARTPREG